MNSGVVPSGHDAPDAPEGQCERMNFRIYRDVFGGWRWEFRLANGHFLDSRDSYDSEEDCIAAAKRARATRIVLAVD
jgi:uncharacterized protein YegP (UPF0339 family)